MTTEEDNVMVKVASLFSQLLGVVSRADFGRLVTEHRGERNAKGFTCWTQLVAMLFCQLARAESLREICNGLVCCEGKLVHLGVRAAPNKSTLSYANQHRPAELFEAFFWATLSRLRAAKQLACRKPVFTFKNKLLSLDSTTVSLCLSLFPWARFRRTKGGVKLHVLLDHDDYMPCWLLITEAKQHDVRAARLLNLPEGSIVAMDRGYNDYSLFSSWIERGVFFVTRLKEDAVFEVVSRRKARGVIRADQEIRLTGADAVAKCPHALRRVVVWDDEGNREIVLLTNQLEFPPETIAAIYKDRWEIELFFKTLKQNLKVKTFVGTSENALRIQIWTALLALLLLKWLHHLSACGWSFANLAAMLRLNLFTYRDLTQWLKNPSNTPSIAPPLEQLCLPLAGLGQPPAWTTT
jgi:hypothetical protein